VKLQRSKKSSRKTNPLAVIDTLAALAGNFDYRVDPEDFVLYELARAIDEDRASLDDPEFQNLIDEGIHTHVESNLALRAELTGIFRHARQTMTPETQVAADRLIGALEDLASSLRDAAVVVRTYTAYLVRQLEQADGIPSPAEELARHQIEEWRSGRRTATELNATLLSIGRPAVAASADLLFDAPEDRASAEVAIETLSRIGSPSAARALAHAVSEPMLDEETEQLAFERLKTLWPLPRDYMFMTLRRHEHEDLPVRWFQVFAECGEVEAVDRTLEEFGRHAADAAYRDDLITILEFLRLSGDPALSAKVIETLNDPKTPQAAAAMFEEFLKTYRATPESSTGAGNPWRQRDRAAELHDQYRKAAKLADAGHTREAVAALDQLLAENPDYAFATMLKQALG
jgi:hypothetical protein